MINDFNHETCNSLEDSTSFVGKGWRCLYWKVIPKARRFCIPVGYCSDPV